MKTGYLRQLGVYGYDPVEPVVLAALVSGDPLLLVGKAGTGKTFLLNSLSEALRLEHRHYKQCFEPLHLPQWHNQLQDLHLHNVRYNQLS